MPDRINHMIKTHIWSESIARLNSAPSRDTHVREKLIFKLIKKIKDIAGSRNDPN